MLQNINVTSPNLAWQSGGSLFKFYSITLKRLKEKKAERQVTAGKSSPCRVIPTDAFRETP